MRRAALLRLGLAVDRRAYERMAELEHPCVQRHEPGVLRGAQRFHLEAEPGGRTANRREIPVVGGGREHENPPRLLGQGARAFEKRLGDARRQL